MRNLKKILAMVLALVMSLSLMATAGAADFPDVKEDTSFKTAIDVLSGLGVFNGYKGDGTFRPDGEITRAETAAIIYRIVTGDVKDEQVKIYSDYGLFKDVPANSWFAGYVNFCANAEYIKGDGKGNFNPNDKVEGYAALAMILRAIGYTANGGFTGSDWRVQTARVGEARKITKNITSGTLGSNADRKTVAEILYQAIMVDMVDHNVDNTFNGNQGYTTVPLTLGQKTFGLEYVSGVILANEWANLVGDEVLAADTTLMQVTNTYATQSKLTKDTDGNLPKLKLNDKTELEMQEALDAVGLTYDAHIANPTASTADVITLDKSDINVVAYNEGKGVYPNKDPYLNNATWASIEKLAEEEGLKLGTADETEYYINYEEKWEQNCMSYDRISYAISKAAVAADADWQKYINKLLEDGAGATIATPADSEYPGHYLAERTIKIDLNLDGAVDDDVPCWVVAIRPENTINVIDQDIMQEIFYTADRIGTNGTTGSEQLQNYAIGEVYVGTTSMKDYSDEMNWRDFQAKYFIVDENTRLFDTCAIGNSLRVIDNNGDGKAEYVLRIDYTQDKVIGTYKGQPAGYNKAIGEYEGNLLYNPDADKIEQGTVFNYTVIDKKLYVWPAPVVTGVAATKDFNKITITVDGEVYNQSGIKNDTRLDENIMLMEQSTTYNMYMDVYGNNVRSYDLAQGSKWALLTEMYPTSDRNSNYVQNWGAIAEVKIQDADVEEYPVTVNNGSQPNPFFNPTVWTWGARNYLGVNPDPDEVISISDLYNPNYLQPAVAHLDIGELKNTVGGFTVTPAVWNGRTNGRPTVTALQFWGTDWNRYVAQADARVAANGAGSTYGVFNYGTEIYDNGTPANVNDDIANPTFSFTNVASYVDNDGTLTLRSASKLSTDRSSGARLYRVGTDAAVGVKSTVSDAYLWQIGTEADLVQSMNDYLAANGGTVTVDSQTFTAGQDWFNYFANSANKGDGDGIFPVFESDYVQLDLTKGDKGQALTNDIAVKAGTRHYHIADTATDANGKTISNYKVDYNTNSNSYVDATINTEFYIVLPGNAKSIQYKLGYADLPTILSENIRAAYAVAHNTAAQNDGQDYWVADVIVIELDELTYDYDSISLVYNNPYVQNGYTRYGDTLNNDWRTLQPDYDGLAKMGITPKDGNFSTTSWGTKWGLQYSWSYQDASQNYAFWKLYQTELTAPGQLNVGDVKKIIKGEYNDNGIYAGQITRVEELEESGYLDVSVQNTGFVQTHAIDVNYGTANEVPFYRITSTRGSYGTIYSATLMNPNQSLRWSDIQNGDYLIWVYDQTNPKQLSFVIDLGTRYKDDGSIDYDAAFQVAWLKALYDDIEDETANGMPTPPVVKEILVEVKAAAGQALPEDYTTTRFEADKGSTIIVPIAGLAKPGATITSIAKSTDPATDIKGNAVVIDGVSSLVFTDVQASFDLIVTYAVEQVALGVDVSAITGGTNNVTITPAVAGWDGNADKDVDYGVEYTVTVENTTSVDTANKIYTVTADTLANVTLGDVEVVNATSFRFTVTLTGDANLTVAVANKPTVAITWVKTDADLDTTQVAALDAITTAPIGEALTFTITPKDATKIITGISYQAPGGEAVDQPASAPGEYTIPADAVVAPGLRITIKSGDATYDVGVTAPAAGTDIFVNYTAADGTTTAGAVTAGTKTAYTVKNDGSVVINSYVPIQLTTATANAADGKATVTVSDDNLTITFSNVTGAFDVVVEAKPNP